ncbi:hypothetical protein WL95_29785 [Burkholderia cepacia]|nr:hypothetical protein WL95_29785 [Burkholderia cepacia]
MCIAPAEPPAPRKRASARAARQRMPTRSIALITITFHDAIDIATSNSATARVIGSPCVHPCSIPWIVVMKCPVSRRG